MSGPDPLFAVRNNFYLGAYQKAISDASNLVGLSDEQKVERDVYVYRSYIELGSYEVRTMGLVAYRPDARCCVARLDARSALHTMRRAWEERAWRLGGDMGLRSLGYGCQSPRSRARAC